MSAKIQYILSAAVFTAAAAISFAPAAFAQTASDTVSFVNFENRSVGVYGNAEAKEDFKRNDYDKSWWYAMDKNNGENSKVVYDGEEHGNVLQLKYPKGCVGPNDSKCRQKTWIAQIFRGKTGVCLRFVRTVPKGRWSVGGAFLLSNPRWRWLFKKRSCCLPKGYERGLKRELFLNESVGGY